MIRQEAILQSPVRILDLSIHGGLGRGHLGLILAPAGVGKSACLAQIGLDALLRGRPVLHVALGQAVEHVSARYDALFEELAERVNLKDRRGVGESVARRRLIWASRDDAFPPRALDEALGAFEANLHCAPCAILIDGFPWVDPDAAGVVGALKERATRAGAELWMTGRHSHAREALGSAQSLPPRGSCAALVDIGVFLEPRGRDARLTLVKDFDRYPEAAVGLVLDAGALSPEPDAEVPSVGREPRAFTLLASGSAGAEEEFGVCAERWGVGEVNFTFAGRSRVARMRGLVELPEKDLERGHVSAAYVKAHLHRDFTVSPELQRILQAIWHQVSAAGEVFSIGVIRPDRTTRGGTGWAVELARHWGKPVHLFDQKRNGWFRWAEGGWVAEVPPEISRARFAGAGSRALTENGRDAIRELFERSFGPAH